jgi:hypothetical protein
MRGPAPSSTPGEADMDFNRLTIYEGGEPPSSTPRT